MLRYGASTRSILSFSAAHTAILAVFLGSILAITVGLQLFHGSVLPVFPNMGSIPSNIGTASTASTPRTKNLRAFLLYDSSSWKRFLLDSATTGIEGGGGRELASTGKSPAGTAVCSYHEKSRYFWYGNLHPGLPVTTGNGCLSSRLHHWGVEALKPHTGTRKTRTLILLSIKYVRRLVSVKPSVCQG